VPALKSSPKTKVASFLLRLFEHGLPQDDAVLHYMASTHGGVSPRDFRVVLANRDDPDAASLAELLLFPDNDALNRLELLLEGEEFSPMDAQAVAEALEGIAESRAILPGGEEVPVILEQGDATRFVERLRLEHTPPSELTEAVTAEFPDESGAPLKVALRHSRLEWTVARIIFLAALIRNIPAKDDPLEVLLWALTYLGALPDGVSAMDSLGMKYAELTTRLRRSLDFHAALSKSSFEVMMAQGVRAPLLHPDAIRRELAMLETVCLAVAGRPAWTLAGMTETDLGEVDDGEAALDILGRLEG
jgi:hypothetical protein